VLSVSTCVALSPLALQILRDAPFDRSFGAHDLEVLVDEDVVGPVNADGV